MKIQLLNILLIFSITIYGQDMYCTSQQNLNSIQFRSTSSYNYQSNKNNSIVGYSTSNFGYTTRTGYSTYKGNHNSLYTGRNYYKPGYSSTGTGAHRPGGGPRKSAQRPFSGNFLEDLADWWRIYTDSDWPGYVDPDYWDEFLAEYPEYEDEARDWYENQGMRFPGDPDDPFLEPVGEFPIGLLLFIMFAYLFYKINNKRTKKL